MTSKIECRDDEDLILEVAKDLLELCKRFESKPYLLQKCQEACFHMKDVSASLIARVDF